MAPPELRVTVVYCAPGCEDVSVVTLADGATVGYAIGASGELVRRPDVAASSPDVGIWGRPCGLTQRVEDGDRVEIYRPLIVDPKEARVKQPPPRPREPPHGRNPPRASARPSRRASGRARP